MFTIQQGRLTDWLKYESKDGERFSRENWEVGQGNGILVTGMVIAATSTGMDVDSGSGDGNTGNGTLSAVTATPSVVPGGYLITLTSPTAFSVVGQNDPTFNQTGVVGTAFNVGGLAFTITAGATAFVAGDTFSAYVRAESFPAAPIGTGYTVGTRLGIVTEPYDTTTDKKKVAVVTRDARIGASRLVFPVGLTPAAHAAVIEQLATQRIFPVLEV